MVDKHTGERHAVIKDGSPGTSKMEFVKCLGEEVSNDDHIAALKGECAFGL